MRNEIDTAKNSKVDFEVIGKMGSIVVWKYIFYKQIANQYGKNRTVEGFDFP